mgnify:CR=1 FL=1
MVSSSYRVAAQPRWALRAALKIMMWIRRRQRMGAPFIRLSVVTSVVAVSQVQIFF